MSVFEIKRTFQELYDKQPELIVRSPARINLIGEHTDYNQGFVLPAAINKEIQFAIALNDSNEVNFYSLQYEEQAAIDLQAVTPSDTVWLSYLSGVIDQLQKAGHRLRGFDCVFGGNIPLGAGLSSSAAITCGIGFIINELFKLGLEPRDLMHFAQQAEHTFVGVQCGIMDQFANIMGREQHAIKLDCLSLNYEYVPLNFEQYSILLCDTKVKHSLASSAYNTRKEECIEGLKIIKEKFNQVESMQDVDMAMLNHLSKELDEVVFKRCTYVIEENDRVQEACQQLKEQDIIGFGKNLYKSHHGLSHLYDVSCKELDFLIERAKASPYVVGARMMGGGFGGCTINIIKIGKEELFIDDIRQAYSKEFGISPEVYETQISKGTSVVC